MRLVIRGGTVYDPESSREGVVEDLLVEKDRVVAGLEAVDQVIDAQGLAVLPAGIDLRSTVAGYGWNYTRLWGGLPSPREVGETYARLGYTHIHEPWLTFATAGYVHQELAAIPWVDTSASLTLNLRDFDIRLRDPAAIPEVSEAWAYLLEHCRALNLRVVEPYIDYRQDFYRHRSLPLAAVVDALVKIIEASGLPLTLEATPELLALDLPVLPGLHLGGIGPALVDEAALERALQLLGRGLPGDMGLFLCALPPGLPSRQVKIDLGWFRPFDLNVRPQADISRRGLALALAGPRDRLAFSVASALQAPAREYAGWLARLESQGAWGGSGAPVASGTPFGIQDWVRATRTLPGRYLGLADRGHLKPGARADIALYDLPGQGRSQSWADSLGRCRLLFKAGEIIVQDYEVVGSHVPKTCYYRRTQAVANRVVAQLCQSRSFRPENVWVRSHPDVHWQQVN